MNPETLLPIILEVYSDAHIYEGAIWTNSPLREVSPQSWEFLMSLCLKLKITVSYNYAHEMSTSGDDWWDRFIMDNDVDEYDVITTVDDLNHHYLTPIVNATESEIKDAIIECALAIKGGE
jgi:hypothetical protein